jgi:hypothetical protein
MQTRGRKEHGEPDATNWILATGQAWKLYVALAGFCTTLVLFTLAIYSLLTAWGQFLAFAACGMFLGFATFTWFTLALRCPRCSNKLVWTMVSSRPHSSWLIDLALLDHCPICGQELARKPVKHR